VRHTALALLFAAAVRPGTASAQTGANILLVVNSNSRASDEIAEYYSRKRGIPGEQIFHIAVQPAEEISRSSYESLIERPIGQWLATHSAQDRILYIVLTKDVPLRIAGTEGQNGTVASVDSELTLLYRKQSGFAIPAAGQVKNPYFAGDAPIATAKPFTHRFQDLYLVTRLDGYTVADVKALIDRGVAPSQDGRILLDGRLELATSPGNRWLMTAAAALKKLPDMGDRVVLDTSVKILRDESSVLGYYSWGSNDRTEFARHLGLQFVPGAIGGEFVSTDARTFQEPPADWRVNDKPFKGSHQSLIGDLIRDGITGVAGHVAEPFLNATIRPDVLFPAYVAGFNLAESFYLAMPSVSWQTVVIGDPLCAPFRTAMVADSDLDPGIDPATELPTFLSARRVNALTAAGVKPDAAKLFAKSEVHLVKQDPAGTQQLLEQATLLDDGFIDAHLALSAMYQSSAQWDAAIARLQRVIAKSPNQQVALNDLAYILATQKQAPEQALPFAKRAYALPNAGPELADTLAWIYHLLGQDATAEPLITAAARQRPSVAEIHWHAAAIFAGTGNPDAATRELETALRLDSNLGSRADVQALRNQLASSK
jgi:uncharacterized protein (TIGR03790 family)